MALTITETLITSDMTPARAEYRPHAAGDGSGAWVVSTRTARLLDRNQAISAMTIAEERTRPGPEQNRALIEALENELP
jgi:hypothetical protein